MYLKPPHGVFDSADELVSTFDEGWEAVMRGGGNVVSTIVNNTTSHVIDMGRRIGYEGGSNGTG